MRSILQTIAAVGAVFFCVGASAPERIDYTLTPILESGALRAIEIDVSFRGEADGETTLRLPDDWGGQVELYRSIEGLTVISGGTLRAADRPAHRLIEHRPNARIHLRYRLIQDWEGAPRAELGNTYRATIQPSYFHFVGEGAFVSPDNADRATRVRVRTRAMPREWSFASDLEHPDLRLERLWSSITVGGDFRVLRDPETNVRIAIRGAWSFSDAALMQEVAHIVGGQRRFWGDPASPYLVTVLQLAGPDGWISVGGTGLGDAFSFFATANGPAATITRTLAHESLHTWVPAQIGGMPQEGEPINYWLSEGFTDFYTGRLLVRDRVWTPQQFADDLNDMLRAYAQSPVRTEPNARILADFWNNQDVEKLPYQRGRLLALLWDARLRANGKSFDDVVLGMRARARSANQPLVAATIFPAVSAEYDLDPSAELQANIDAGTPITLPADLLQPCGVITSRDVVPFHRGFDIEATVANQNTITGVDPGLPAYAAGVRDGMTLIRRDSGEIGNSELEIAYVLRDGETERTIRYMPRGRGTFTLQRFELAQDLEGERLVQCLRVLGG